MAYTDEKRLHQDVTFLGLRAQATAIGFVQLCRELHDAGVLDDGAMDRIKCSISGELSLNCPRSAPRDEFARDMRARLDRLFAGQERVGDRPSFGRTADEIVTQ
jgi:hypothetical protein